MKYLLFTLSTIISLNAFAQSAEEKAFMEYATPGKEHQQLAREVGKWKLTINAYMAPGAAPIQSQGTCVSEQIMGGKFIRSKHSGDMMGMPFEGENTSGFDKATKKYFFTWIDNMGTGVMRGEGTYDEAKKMYNYVGTNSDPMTGKQQAIRETMQWINDDTQEMNLYMTHEGKEVKMLVIKFERIK